MTTAARGPRSLSPFLLVALAMSGACDTAPAPSAEVPATIGGDETTGREESALMLATVQTDRGTELSFLEPAPGTLLVAERGTFAKPPVGGAGHRSPERAVDIFRRLAPGRALPPALVEAQSRFDRMEAQLGGIHPIRTESPPQPTADDAVTMSTFALEDANPDDALVPLSWFVATQCPNQSASKKVCLGRRSGDETFSAGDVHYLDSNVASYRGTVRVRVRQKTWWSWSTKHDFNIQAGEVWWIYWSSGTLDATVAEEFREATGDGYHYFAAAYNGQRTYN